MRIKTSFKLSLNILLTSTKARFDGTFVDETPRYGELERGYDTQLT